MPCKVDTTSVTIEEHLEHMLCKACQHLSAQQIFDSAKNLLRSDEGLMLHPYRCTVGKLTIGYGRNLDDVGISTEEAEYLLDNDVKICVSDLERGIPWFGSLSLIRQAVLISMRFNLGFEGLFAFRRMLAALKAGDYSGAAREMLSSKWSADVGDRANRLAYMVEFDKLPD